MGDVHGRLPETNPFTQILLLTLWEYPDIVTSMTNLTNIQPEKMYTIAEVAEMTGYNGRTLRRWADRGKLNGARRDGLADQSPYVVPGTTVLELISKKKA